MNIRCLFGHKWKKILIATKIWFSHDFWIDSALPGGRECVRCGKREEQ